MKLLSHWWLWSQAVWTGALFRCHHWSLQGWTALNVAWDALEHWGWERRPRLLLRGAPALLAGVGGVAVVLLARGETGGQSFVYRNLALSHLQAKQYGTARIAGERLLLLDADDPESECLLALALMGDGQTERGLYLLRKLAPLDRAGQAQAHLTLANHYLGQQPAAADLAEYHLRRVVEAHPGAVVAHGQLGQLYYRNNQWDRAEPHLRLAVAELPELSLPLATIYHQRHRPELVQRWADQVIEHADQDLARSPFNLPARLAKADACVLLGRYPQAVSVLEQGLPVGDAPRLQFQLATVYLAWADSLPDQLAPRLPLLERALLHAPHHAALLRRLRDSAEPASLDAVSAQGQSALHLLLALQAARRGQPESIRRCLQQACAAKPIMAVAACNLAWTLAHDDPAEPDHARALVDAVVALRPQDGRFRQARGQILLKLGHWPDAQRDLEFALTQLPNDPSLHRALAEVYQQLGLAEKAAEHSRRAATPPS